MNGNSKRPPALCALLVPLFLLAALAPTSALAAGNHEFLAQFGENCGDLGKIQKGECSRAGETVLPGGVATDPTTGHVFVADFSNERVDEFTPWGEFVKAFGWDVAPGAVDEEQEIRVRASSGQFKLGFEAQTTVDLAFDPPGNEGEGSGSVEAALEALPAIGAVSVTRRTGTTNGSSPFIYVVHFESPAGANVPQLTANNGATPLSGPETELAVNTRVDGSPAGTGLEGCTEISECKLGSEGEGSGQFRHPTAIAIDSEHNLYVVDPRQHRIEKFDSAGRFLLTFGGEVDQTTSGNVCTAASGDACKAGKVGSGPGEFSEWIEGITGVAVGPDGVVYVGDKERVQEFDPGGTFLGEIPLPGRGTVTSLAVTAAGDIAVGSNEFGSGFPPPFPDVWVLDPSGSKTCTIEAGRPSALASAGDSIYVFAGRVYGGPNPEFETSEIREYDSNCERLAIFADHEITTVTGSFGIAVNPIGGVYASNAATEANSYIRAYGPAPVFFESPASAAPDIASQYATEVGTGSATLRAVINPHFWTDATFHVEYGSEPCGVSACASTGPQPLTSAAVNASLSTAPVEIEGLEPDRTYHYRFVAESSGGGPSIGAERTFHTYLEAPAALPDARTYEMVSPRDKAGGEVGIPGPAGGGAFSSTQPQQASPSGEAISYASATPFGEDPQSAPAASQYLSRRGSDGTWSTQNIDPRFDEGELRDPIVGFSEDLSHAALAVFGPALTPEAPTGFPNLYWRDNASGGLATTATNEPQFSVLKSLYCMFYGGASADSRHVFLGAHGALLPGDPVSDSFNLYEWSADRPAEEALQLVSVLPDGTAAQPTAGASSTSFGELLNESGCTVKSRLMRHAISVDGSKAFWTYEGSLGSAPQPLLARVDGAETIQLDRPNSGTSGAGGGGKYWDASLDGSRIFFTDMRKLTTAPTAAGTDKPDLYLYDFEAEEGQRLTDLTPQTPEAASVSEMIGTDEEGTYAYFIAKGVLAANANAEGETAKAGGSNLYAWHEGQGLRFVAQTGDGVSWRSARVSPDGTHLAFLSSRSLTGFDSADAQSGKADAEAFLYDYGADSLVCASCNGAEARPQGSASFPGWSAPYVQPRYLTAGGSRLYFQTKDALDPRDTDEKQDVYESEAPGAGSCTEGDLHFEPASGRCVYLISTGSSSDDSFFLDASSDGRDLFFSTREGIAFGDGDGAFDVYDARIGGHGAAAPPGPSCEGEGCRGAISQAPPQSAPGSSRFDAPPQQTSPRPCPPGRHPALNRKKAKARCTRPKPSRPKRHGRHRHANHDGGKHG